MKKVVPPAGKVAKEARECVQEHKQIEQDKKYIKISISLIEFLSFIHYLFLANFTNAATYTKYIKNFLVNTKYCK